MAPAIVSRDLTTPRARPTYTIDGGRVLEMRSPYDLTLEEFDAIEALFLTMGACMMALGETPKKGKEAREAGEKLRATRRDAMSRICAIALGRPDALKVMGELRAVVVCNDFLSLCAPVIGSLKTGRAMDPEIPSLSPNSFLSSAGSTKGPRPGTGRAKRP